MPSKNKLERLSNLKKVPFIAGLDHRHFLDKDGNDVRLKSLPRQKRRKIAAGGRKIASEYKKILLRIHRSGAGYPIDKFLRELSIEYTHRYASSGIFTQPLSFNYFEPFCEINLVDGTVAPFAEPCREHDHLFSIVDYFDYVTSADGGDFTLTQLMELPEKQVFHFTSNGDIGEFTFLTAEGREFLVSGFSMVRYGSSLHWYLVGGEILSEQEWNEQTNDETNLDIEYVPEEKIPFLSESIADRGTTFGAPVALEGTRTAIRTITSGETDLTTCKHIGRLHMSERENAFEMLCDDPEVFNEIKDPSVRMDRINLMHDRIERAAVLWNLAEAMFQLPEYFAVKVNIKKSVAAASGRRVPTKAKGGRGVGVQFFTVSAIDFVDQEAPVVTAYTPPRYEVETEGHWRRLKPDGFGRDPNGSRMRGKTWVKSKNEWRERPKGPRTIYVKSSVAAAKIKAQEYVKQAAHNDSESSKRVSGERSMRGVLYVLRCTVMEDRVYKVGWTSGTAEERARQLSSATGVPISFIVVDAWPHPDAEALEKGVHALLAPYRINEGREFFRADYSVIRNLIELEIERANSK